MTICVPALLAALEQFEREYEGTVCAACQSEKWANSPFCRTCSIRLQRAGMMARLKTHARYNGTDWRKWPEWRVNWYWKKYDIALDYLINTKSQKRRSTEDGEAEQQGKQRPALGVLSRQKENGDPRIVDAET